MRQSNECSSFAQVKNARSTFGSSPFHNGNGFAMPYTAVTLDNCASISFLQIFSFAHYSMEQPLCKPFFLFSGRKFVRKPKKDAIRKWIASL